MKQLPENHDIRILIFQHNIKHFEIAKYLNIAPSTLSIWLNRKLRQEEKDSILMAITDLK